MENDEMIDEVKILHIHKGAEGKRDFIEYIDIRSGKHISLPIRALSSDTAKRR